MKIVFLFFLLIFIAIISLEFKWNIENFFINNINYNEKIKENNKVSFISNIEIYIFGKIKIFNIKIDKDKLEKAKISQKIKELDIFEMKQNKPINKENVEAIKKLKVNLEEFKLNIDIGTKNVILTSGIVALLSTIIAILFTKIIKNYNEENYFFNIKPKYIEENVLKLKFKGIISIKMIHILNVIFFIIKTRRVKKNERTSNTRSYDYSYE